MAVSVNLAKLLDRAYEDSSLEEVLDAPVSALAGVTDAKAEKLAEALNVKTIGDLGGNKYVAAAVALAQLGKHAG
ncbi:hypothetical protein GCM10011512_27350 [Tersicoccus solisilvae]|uniref:50S ribosomal protein L7/L12 n=1 Tax=Tersicoccus solisilvae TaxID=1882339 RepID=A0ABQ1PL25_9MICC|nr:hypothetical protein [Tersicoccus solisilvae]GGC98976.1 hypothetical protein GCM10011512_27350 [Tersicoccus solisilvae]